MGVCRIGNTVFLVLKIRFEKLWCAVKFEQRAGAQIVLIYANKANLTEI